MQINDNFCKLPGSYLFSEIARRVAGYTGEHPEAALIRLGIGDVTRPLPPAVLAAMHAAVDEQVVWGLKDDGHGRKEGQFRRKVPAQHRAQGSRKHLMMDELFVYIRTHITEEITLAQLEQVFYISRFHIAREFKRQTGQTLHSYIVKTKLDLCCHYIEQGRPITEVYRLGGFGGYNHFFRAFKQEYGMTPKQYFRSVQKDAHA